MRTLDECVERDRTLEHEASSKTAALMEHRWAVVHGDGFGVREYARALGRSEAVVAKYVEGWTLLCSRRDNGTVVTPDAALELAAMGEVKRAATEIVAETHSVSPQTVRKRYAPEVARARDIIEREPDRPTGIAKAREHVERTGRMADRRQRAHEDKRSNLPRVYVETEYELDKARRALQNAIGWIRGSGSALDDDCISLLIDSLAKVRALMELLNLAIVGEESVDWDAALAQLSEEDE